MKNHVVFQPETHTGMQDGIRQLAKTIRPTLGPLPRNVAIMPIEPKSQNKAPEILDSAGTIARRIYEISGRSENTGAMFLRQMIWKQYEEQGDGAATAVVLFQCVYDQGIKYVTAGGNAMILRKYLENGMRIVLNQLQADAELIRDRKTMQQLAQSLVTDQALAEALGEIVDIIGPDAPVEIRSGRSRLVEREYIPGIIYPGGYHSAVYFEDMHDGRIQLENPAVCLTDLPLEEPEALIKITRMAYDAGYPALVIMGRSISEQSTGVLAAISQRSEHFKALAVKLPEHGATDKNALLEDLGIMTGSLVLFEALGDTLGSIKPEVFGRARLCWADKNFCGFVRGGGSPTDIRQRINGLRQRMNNANNMDVRKQTRLRLGKMMGGLAVLYAGGTTEIEIEARKEKAKRALEALQSASSMGILPGGGAALLSCQPYLLELANQTDDQEAKVAYRILARALEEPTRVILENAGHEPNVWIERIKQAGSGSGFDVHTHSVTDMVTAGIIDSAGVTHSAVKNAFSTAALGITVDVIIHKKKPTLADQP